MKRKKARGYELYMRSRRKIYGVGLNFVVGRLFKV
jgi:hypothetical protein